MDWKVCPMALALLLTRQKMRQSRIADVLWHWWRHRPTGVLDTSVLRSSGRVKLATIVSCVRRDRRGCHSDGGVVSSASTHVATLAEPAPPLHHSPARPAIRALSRIRVSTEHKLQNRCFHPDDLERVRRTQLVNQDWSRIVICIALIFFFLTCVTLLPYREWCFGGQYVVIVHHTLAYL